MEAKYVLALLAAVAAQYMLSRGGTSARSLESLLAKLPGMSSLPAWASQQFKQPGQPVHGSTPEPLHDDDVCIVMCVAMRMCMTCVRASTRRNAPVCVVRGEHWRVHWNVDPHAHRQTLTTRERPSTSKPRYSARSSAMRSASARTTSALFADGDIDTPLAQHACQESREAP